MLAKKLAEVLLTVPNAKVVMSSYEDPSAGLVPVAIVYTEEQVEICEDLDDEDFDEQ